MDQRIKDLIAAYSDSKNFNLKISYSAVIKIIKEALSLNGSVHFTPQTCCMILMILKNLGKLWSDLETDLRNDLLNTIYENAEDFNPRDIAIVLNSISKMGLKWTSLKSAVQDALVNAININDRHFNSQDIANIINALANMGLTWRDLNPKLQDNLLNAINRNALDFNHQATANIVNAMAKMGLEWKKLTPHIQDALLNAIKINSDYFSPQNIANTLNAIARMGLEWGDLEQSLHDALLKAISRNVSEFNTLDISSTLHALMLLEVHDSRLFELVHNNLNSEELIEDLSCLQLYTAYVYFELNMHIEYRKFERINHNLITKVSAKAKEALRVSSAASKLQESVKNGINRNYIGKVESEIRLACTIVDILLPAERIVIEVDGPSHFLANNEYNIAAIRKKSFIHKLGYKCININYKVWDNLKNSKEQDKYVKEFLLPYRVNYTQPDNPYGLMRPTTHISNDFHPKLDARPM